MRHNIIPWPLKYPAAFRFSALLSRRSTSRNSSKIVSRQFLHVPGNYSRIPDLILFQVFKADDPGITTALLPFLSRQFLHVGIKVRLVQDLRTNQCFKNVFQRDDTGHVAEFVHHQRIDGERHQFLPVICPDGIGNDLGKNDQQGLHRQPGSRVIRSVKIPSLKFYLERWTPKSGRFETQILSTERKRR